MSLVVIGLGSPFLCDDSVGIRVVRALSQYKTSEVRFVEAHAGGLLLLEELVDAKNAIIIDALIDKRRKAGTVLVCALENKTRNTCCGHDCTLTEALEIGHAMGMNLPPDQAITLVAVVAEDVTTFSEKLTPAVEAALKNACDKVCDLILLNA